MRHPTNGGAITNIVSLKELENISQELYQENVKNGTHWKNFRFQMVMGNIPSEKGYSRSRYSAERYKFFLDADFEISSKCCNIMKKTPIKKYSKDTHRVPITAQMADESRLRTQQWIKAGCNGFEMKNPISNPMSFWTEQDVLMYIKLNNLPICSVYGDIVYDSDIDGQITIFDYEGVSTKEMIMDNIPKLKTTGCSRTGCVCCGFGAQCREDDRFVQLKQSHPQMYKILDVAKNNGYTMREAIEWCNEHGNLNIKL